MVLSNIYIYIFVLNPCLGKWSNLTNIFQMGWNQWFTVEERSTDRKMATLLMEEIPNNHLECIKPHENWDKLHVNWCRISFISGMKFQKRLVFFYNHFITVGISGYIMLPCLNSFEMSWLSWPGNDDCACLLEGQSEWILTREGS